jgi:hypothetical protein
MWRDSWPVHQPGARAAREQRLVVDRTGLQHSVHGGVGLQPLQRADGREDDEELPRGMPRQRVGRAHPQRLELLRLVGHRFLALGHARHQEGHVEAARQVAVGDPVGEHEHLGARQCQALGCALRRELGLAVQCRDLCA